MSEIPPLPAGFKLDGQPGADTPPLPPGFKLDGPTAPDAQPGVLDRAAGLAAMQFPIATPVAEALLHNVTSMFASPAAGIAGLDTAAARAAGVTDANPASVIEGVQQAGTYQPRTPGGQALTKLGGLLPGLITKGADATGQAASDATNSPALGAAVNTGVQMLPALLMRGRAPKVVENVSRRATAPDAAARPAAAAEKPPAAAQRPAGLASVSEAAPSLEKLKTDAQAAYKRAEDAGIKISDFSFKRLKGRILNEVGSKLNPTLHPDTTAAIKDIVNTKGEISLEKLDQLRQVARDAEGSIKPADKMRAGEVVDLIDEYVDNLGARDVTQGDAAGAAALKEARNLYSRQKKAESIQRLFTRAEDKAGANFSQSGLENSLRQEFKALALNDKQMRRYTPEEQAAIRKVARGAPLQNVLRYFGKFAPTGPVGALTGLFSVGVAGPAGTLLPAAGAVSRYAATRMTMRNAAAAEQLMRRGPRNAMTTEAEAPAPVKRNALLEN